ncbi:2304_t:CDS:2 [Cetraspora pellucida]|uniref:2304_t:CDS:1 n=1 Tax=Cetraspora pellucida TaxID=1433469 RepID=A0A9N9EEL7_9GLOM|nr:2304_t:CDS:2 [Cetraspora pellucida]
MAIMTIFTVCESPTAGIDNTSNINELPRGWWAVHLPIQNDRA